MYYTDCFKAILYGDSLTDFDQALPVGGATNHRAPKMPQ